VAVAEVEVAGMAMETAEEAFNPPLLPTGHHNNNHHSSHSSHNNKSNILNGQPHLTTLVVVNPDTLHIPLKLSMCTTI